MHKTAANHSLTPFFIRTNADEYWQHDRRHLKARDNTRRIADLHLFSPDSAEKYQVTSFMQCSEFTLNSTFTLYRYPLIYDATLLSLPATNHGGEGKILPNGGSGSSLCEDISRWT